MDGLGGGLGRAVKVWAVVVGVIFAVICGCFMREGGGER